VYRQSYFIKMASEDHHHHHHDVPNMATPEEIREFVAQAGDSLLVVDTLNPGEPADEKYIAKSGMPSATHRPKAVNLVWDRDTKSMPLPTCAKDTPIITHCGQGRRGQQAKEFLQEHGFTKVINGGGPFETEQWKEFGDK
jgi:rhodanese-related sulfurtransferase